MSDLSGPGNRAGFFDEGSCIGAFSRAQSNGKRKLAMQRSRAIAIAAAEQKARQSRLIVAASLLLLPAALLLLLISP